MVFLDSLWCSFAASAAEQGCGEEHVQRGEVTLVNAPCAPLQVCELDIIFNFEKAYFILDEFLLGGEVLETSRVAVGVSMEESDTLQEVEYRHTPSVKAGPAAAHAKCVYRSVSTDDGGVHEQTRLLSATGPGWNQKVDLLPNDSFGHEITKILLLYPKVLTVLI